MRRIKGFNSLNKVTPDLGIANVSAFLNEPSPRKEKGKVFAQKQS